MLTGVPQVSSLSESEPLSQARAPAEVTEAARVTPAPRAAVASKRRPRLGLTFLVCSLMMAASLLMVVWNLQDSSLNNANTGSRYATVESLVDYGTYHIDRSRYVRTIDKYQVDGHYISSKPPTLPTLAAGVYWAYQHFTGKTIARYEGDVVRTVSFFTGGVCHILFLAYFYRLCRLAFRRRLAVLTATAGACFAYLGVGYATHINNHSTAAAFAVMGLYYAVRIRQQRDARWWHWPLAGLVLGVLPAIDLPGLAVSAALGLYLLTFDWKKTLLWFAPALLPGLATHLYLTYQISGSFKPFYFNGELKTYGNFYFRKPSGIDALREPKLVYAFNALLGHHGLFSMTPLYIFGAYELARSLVKRRWLGESLVVAATVLAFLGFFIFRTRNYGGWCVGMRWFVPIMPLLLLYFGMWVDRVRLTRVLWAAVLAAFCVSCFNVQDALTSPFQYSVWHNWLENAPNRGRVGKQFNLPKRPAPKSKAKAKAAPKAAPPAPAPAAPGAASGNDDAAGAAGSSSEP